MGITLDIFKSSMGDFSGGGLSSRAERVTLVNVEGPSEPSREAPAVALLAGHTPETVRAVPVIANGSDYELVEPEGSVGPMMGGCYVGTADSRFSRAVEEITGRRFYGAVALHDRYETTAQYAAYAD